MEQLGCSQLVSRGITGTTALKPAQFYLPKLNTYHPTTWQFNTKVPTQRENHRFVHQKTHFLKQHYSLYPKLEAIQISINSENIIGDVPVVQWLDSALHCGGRGFNPWLRN